jgi:hypothetical protein
MGLSRRQFTKEFKLAAVRRLEQGEAVSDGGNGCSIVETAILADRAAIAKDGARREEDDALSDNGCETGLSSLTQGRAPGRSRSRGCTTKPTCQALEPGGHLTPNPALQCETSAPPRPLATRRSYELLIGTAFICGHYPARIRVRSRLLLWGWSYWDFSLSSRRRWDQSAKPFSLEDNRPAVPQHPARPPSSQMFADQSEQCQIKEML